MKKNKNIIGFIVVFIAILYKYLSFYELDNGLITTGIIIIAIIFNIIIILKKKFNQKKLFLILIPFFMITIISSSLDFVVTLLIALIFSKDNIRDFFKIFFISSLCCYLLTICMYFLGILENHSIRRITEDGTIVRNSLGFSHVNGVFKNLIPIILSGYFLVKEKNIRKYNLFIFIISTILFIVSNSRTGYICVILYLLFTTFKDIINIKIKKKSIKYMFIICTLITILITNFAGQSETNTLNILLSNRPIIWKYYMYDSNAIEFINMKITRIAIDNTYITYLVNYGILTYIIIFLIKYFAIKKIEDNRILLIILILSIYGIFENMVSYGLDFTLIVQFIYLLETKNDESKQSYNNFQEIYKFGMNT